MRLVLVFLTLVVFVSITTPHPIGLEDSSQSLDSESLSIEKTDDISKHSDTSSAELSNEKTEHTVSESRAPELPIAQLKNQIQNPFTPASDLVKDGSSNESSLESDETVSVEDDKVGHRKSSLESAASSQSYESQDSDENKKSTGLPKVGDDGSILITATEAAEETTGTLVQESSDAINSEVVLNERSHKDKSSASSNSGASSESNQSEDSYEHLKALPGTAVAETVKSDGVLQNNEKNINSSESSETAASNESEENVGKSDLPKVEINENRQNIVNVSPIDRRHKTPNDSSLESSDSIESAGSSESNQNNNAGNNSKTKDIPKETTQSAIIPANSGIEETSADDSNNATNNDENNILNANSSESSEASASSDESADSDENIKTNELSKDVPSNVEPAQQSAAIKANDGLKADATLTPDSDIVQNIKSSSESIESADSNESENNQDEIKSSVTVLLPTIAPINVPNDSSISVESDEIADEIKFKSSESGGSSESEQIIEG